MPAYVDDVLIANNQRECRIVDYLVPMRRMDFIECCGYGYDEHNETKRINIIIRIILMSVKTGCNHDVSMHIVSIRVRGGD